MSSELFSVFVDDSLLARQVRVARRFSERLCGLLRHRTLHRSAGLLIDPGGSVHTFGMRFPIDVVFLDRDGAILKTCTHVAPNRARWAPRTTASTLELSSGAGVNLALGQTLRFVRNRYDEQR